MSGVKYTCAFGMLPLVGLVGACGAEGWDGSSSEGVDSVDQGYVSGTLAPPLGPSTSGNLPPFPNGSPNNPAGTYHQGFQLSAAPRVTDEAWLLRALGDANCVAPNMPLLLNESLWLAGIALDGYWSDNLFLDSIQDYFQWVDPDPDPSTPEPGEEILMTFGYDAERARWRAVQRTASGSSLRSPPPEFEE